MARSPVITGDGCWLPLKPLSPPGSVVRRARRLHAESRLLMTTCSSQCQLVLFLVRDLPRHAPGSAAEHKVREQVDDTSGAAKRPDTNREQMADARDNLDAIIESDYLVVGGVWLEIEFDHQVQPGSTDSQSRAEEAFGAHAEGSPIRLATDHPIANVLAARSKALAAVVFSPVCL